MSSAAAIDVGLGPGVGLPSNMTRRRLLELGGAAALTVALARGLPAIAAPAPAAAAPDVAPHLLRSSYASLVGDRFRIDRAGGPPFPVRLVEIRELAGGPTAAVAAADPAHDGFALRFHSPRTPGLEQDVYRFSHPALGSFEMLLVPGRTGRRGHTYGAIINRTNPGPPN